jgi:hypothetical protein
VSHRSPNYSAARSAGRGFDSCPNGKLMVSSWRVARGKRQLACDCINRRCV